MDIEEGGFDDGVSVIFRCGDVEFKVSRESALISGLVVATLIGEKECNDGVVVYVSKDDIGVEMLGYVVEYLRCRKGVDLWCIPQPLRSLSWDELFSDRELGGFGEMKSVKPEYRVDPRDSEEEIKKKRERYDRMVVGWRHPQRGDYGEIREFVKRYVGMIGENEWKKWRQLVMIASWFEINGLVSLCAAVVARYFARMKFVELDAMLLGAMREKFKLICDDMEKIEEFYLDHKEYIKSKFGREIDDVVEMCCSVLK